MLRDDIKRGSDDESGAIVASPVMSEQRLSFVHSLFSAKVGLSTCLVSLSAEG